MDEGREKEWGADGLGNRGRGECRRTWSWTMEYITGFYI